MSLEDCVPKDKFDLDAVRRAEEAGYPAIAPILPELLEWMQDMNWPVARVIAPLLIKIGEPVVPLILEVLKGEDAIWKYWILSSIVIDLDQPTRAPLLGECLRLTLHPTDAEKAEEVDLIAEEILLMSP